VNTASTGLVVDDLYDLVWLEDVRISPDGRQVAYVQVHVDRPNNRYHRAIYLVPTEGGTPRRFTQGRGGDRQPRWSPDGRRLAFVSSRDDEQGQIYLIDIAGGEAQQLTNALNGASDPAWSPDGRRIAFLASVNETERAGEDADAPTPAPTDAWNAKRRQEQRRYDEEQRFDPRVVKRLPYRSGTTYFDDRRRHIYLVELPDGQIDAPVTARRQTDGDLHFAPPTWMPDGQSLLSTATRDPEADSLFAYYDVLRIPITDTAPHIPERLTRAGYSYFDPKPSPDGSQIAFLRLPEDQLLGAGHRVASIPASGGEPQDLTAHTDLNIEQFSWNYADNRIYFLAGWQGDAHIYAIGLPGTATYRQGETLIGGQRFVSEFDSASDGSIAFVAGTSNDPCNLYVRLPDGSERRLTQINAELLAQRRLTPIEELRYLAPDGQEVQGWFLQPLAPAATGLPPLAVYIHGGPHIMWGPGFFSMWHEWQVAAAAGYTVFFCNPRGSEGYGAQWRDAIRGGWGRIDAPDILAGIDHLVDHGLVDPQRIGVTGGSYGGFMTTWLISHDDRFACAVAARGVYNLLTEHSTSDAHELIEIEFSGYPWDLAEELWEHSPVAHAHKIHTPLLLLHSECDYRVPISEAEQLFALLRRRKQTVELVRYPREGHELTRSGEPDHRADHMQRTLAWFDRYCREPRSGT
jgi:dipeptidyl aminopeptidase/acylaminoacyl peptidase